MKLSQTTKDKLFYVLLGFGLMLNVWPAQAGLNTNATVERHYVNKEIKIPHIAQRCEDVYQDGDKTGDALTGAIIGGVIGNNVTKNVDNGGAVGALIGGILGHQNSKAQGGYRRVCSDITTYSTEYQEQYSHSTITFRDQNGQSRTLRFYE